jgi:hypothetical protein
LDWQLNSFFLHYFSGVVDLLVPCAHFHCTKFALKPNKIFSFTGKMQNQSLWFISFTISSTWY